MNVLGVVGIALASTTLVLAQPAPSTIAIEYVAPAACPDEISLRAGVVSRLGRDPFFGDASRKAFVDVKVTAAGYVAAIELREPGRTPSRRAVGPTAKCEDAIGALELALAVIVDPTYRDDPAPAPAPGPAPAPRPVYQGPPRYEPPGWRGLPPPNAPRPPPTAEIAIGGGGITGSVPGTGSGFVFRAGYLQPQFRIGLVVRLAEANSDIAQDLNAGMRISQLGVEGCLRRWLAHACGGVGVGSLSITIRDYAPFPSERGTDYSQTSFLVLLATAIDIPLGRAFLRPTVEIAKPIPGTPIESQGIRYRDPPAGQLAFDLVLGYRW